MTVDGFLLAEIGPDEARPGVLALVVVLSLAVATALLLRSFVKQLRKVDFDEDAPQDGPGPGPGSGPGPGPGSDGPGPDANPDR